MTEEKWTISKIHKEFDVSPQTVTNWLNAVKEKQDPDKKRIAELESELHEMRKELADREVTIDILKKATIDFMPLSFDDGQVRFAKIDIYKPSDIAQRFNVENTPCVVLIKDGKIAKVLDNGICKTKIAKMLDCVIKTQEDFSKFENPLVF